MPDIVIQPAVKNPVIIQVSNVNQPPVEVIDQSKLKFTWQGAWTPAKSYYREDVVRYLGSAYICIESHVSSPSFDISKWEIMVESAGGSGSDATFVYNQTTASAEWVIQHNLGKFPSVTVVDSANDECEGSINHVSINEVVISFSAPFSGKAFLN